MVQSVAPSLAEQNKALVRRYFDEINSHREGVLDELLVPEYVDHNPPPFPNLSGGREGAHQAFREGKRVFPDGWHEIVDQIAEGDRVITLVRAGGTFAEEVLGIPPNGKPVSMSGMAVHRVVDAKLAEHWGIQDVAGLFQRLGLMPGDGYEPALEPGRQVEPPPSRDEVSAALQRFGSIFDRHDASIADQVVPPEFAPRMVGMPPMGSRDVWKQVLHGFLQAFPDFQITLHEQLYDNGRAGLRFTWTGTHQGELMGTPATGRTVHGHGIAIYTIENGLVVQEQGIEDVFGMLAQLGLIQPPGQ